MNHRYLKSTIASLFIPFLAVAQEGHYKKPLWFDVVNNGVKLSEPVIQYDLTSKKSLQLGPLLLKEDFFSINLTSRQKLDADGSKMAFYNQEDMVLFFDWPKEILPYGKLEMTDAKGTVIWSKQLGEAEITDWHEKIVQVKGELAKQGKTEAEIENNNLLKKTYAFFRSKTEPGPELKINEAYKFCLQNTVAESSARICTPFYTMKTVGTQIEMQIEHSVKGLKPSVKFQAAEQPLSGRLAVAGDKPVSFFAQMKSGALIEFTTPVPALKIMDMSTEQVVGENPAPVFATSEALKNKDPLDPINNLWKAPRKAIDKSIFLPGVAGGFFQYDVAIEYLPEEKLRPFADERNLNVTYSQDDTLRVTRDGKNETEPWVTLNPQKEKWNRSYLVTKDDKHEYKSYLDMYRGYAGEASLRLTGLTASGGKTAGMAEVHLAYWFNSLAGWDQYYLSRQRWGVSAKMVSLLTAIPATADDGSTSDVKIDSTIVDLKYRFTPGLWERDESWGALLSYENLNYGNYKVPKIGYGFFWARSMPKIFDDLFNKISFFRYPKWVDLDMVKYSTSMDSKYTLGDDYAINFHGKILWTPRFYGEAGFGAKKYYFLQQDTLQGATLNTFYGTLGIGVNF